LWNNKEVPQITEGELLIFASFFLFIDLLLLFQCSYYNECIFLFEHEICSMWQLDSTFFDVKVWTTQFNIYVCKKYMREREICNCGRSFKEYKMYYKILHTLFYPQWWLPSFLSTYGYISITPMEIGHYCHNKILSNFFFGNSKMNELVVT
jgi:hypothetical protein